MYDDLSAVGAHNVMYVFYKTASEVFRVMNQKLNTTPTTNVQNTGKSGLLGPGAGWLTAINLEGVPKEVKAQKKLLMDTFNVLLTKLKDHFKVSFDNYI